MSLAGAINVLPMQNGQRQAESGALNEPASKKLYLEEGKMFKEVMHIMSRDHKFTISVRRRSYRADVCSPPKHDADKEQGEDVPE